MRHWDRTCPACVEQAERQEPVAYIDHVSGKPKFINGYVVQTDYDIPLYTAPPQAEKQEPVAGLEIGTYTGSGLKNTIKHTDLNSLPSFIAPPRKEWVNLTSQELATLTIENLGHPVNLTFAIEAKLKEKNT